MKKHVVMVARWCNGKAFGLAISRSRVQILPEVGWLVGV